MGYTFFILPHCGYPNKTYSLPIRNTELQVLIIDANCAGIEFIHMSAKIYCNGHIPGFRY